MSILPAGGIARAAATSRREPSDELTRSRHPRIAFVASPIAEAQDARARLAKRYGETPADEADVIVALGGDGLMLQTLHRFMTSGKPIYGMHRGTVGFLMNEFSEDRLPERLAAAETTLIHPLLMRAVDANGQRHEAHAINEVSLFRQKLPGRAAAHPDRRQGAARRTGRRRRDGRDARRLHRL